MIRLALGYSDTEGRTWFIHRAATFGNMLRTNDPHQSRAFPALAELRDWVETLPAHAKAQLADRDLFVYPIDFQAKPATHRLRIDTDAPAMEGAETASGPSVTLSPVNPPPISARTLIGA